jgi:hypothetical protein
MNFYYEFLNKCLDTDRFHFIVCDTDSMIFAVSGDLNRGLGQGFEGIIKDREYYNKWYSSWFPDTKQLVTLQYEHCCYNMVSLATRNYYEDDGNEGKIKQKGVTTKGKVDEQMNQKACVDCIKEGKITMARNYVLRVKEHKMTSQLIHKIWISGIITKSVVSPNQACCPFIYGLTADKYVIENPKENSY